MAKPKQASTQAHLDIEDITNDLVILKTGWVAMVMGTTAINFDLLSEAEQDATIYAYGAFLNSLSFPLQILIRSKKADITAYFASLEEAERTQPNPDLKRQIQKYEDFIKSTVQQKTVLDKRFYLIINYSPLEKGIKGVAPKKVGAGSKAALLADAKNALLPKRDHIIKQTSRLGLTTKQLATQELIELFYDIYNPAPTGTAHVLLDTASYTTPIVEPALEVPTPAPTPSPGAGPTPTGQPQPLPVAPLPIGLDLRPVEPTPKAAPTLPAPPMPEPTLRPVSPQPQPTPASPTPNPTLPPHQADALKNLQQATAKASQLVNTPAPSQTLPNQYQVNVEDRKT